MAFGGSTNVVLHLLAIAREAEVDLTLDDFNRIGDKIPHLGDLKPFGRYVMNDVDRIGGVPVIMKALLDAGLLHGDCLTVTGKTVAENLAEINPPDLDGKILRALDNPIHKTGGITILHGSLAPEGAVVKSAGFDADVFEGTARVFEREQGALDALDNGADQGRRRRRHPLRGAQGRSGHARDARHHRRHQGRRPRARTYCCSPTVDSPAAPPGCASATSLPRRSTAVRSPSCATATGSASTSPLAPSTYWSTRPSWKPAGSAGSRCRRSSPVASWPSTPSWSTPPPPARTAAERRVHGSTGS